VEAVDGEVIVESDDARQRLTLSGAHQRRVGEMHREIERLHLEALSAGASAIVRIHCSVTVAASDST
jgi:hypothetical protein